MVTYNETDLSKHSFKYIAPTGTISSGLMVIGEAGGLEESIEGKAFVGASGKLLNRMLEFIALNRDNVYVTNVLKVRPFLNRKPNSEELKSWRPLLINEIIELRPKVILTLGGSATEALLEVKTPISKIRGQVHEIPIPGSRGEKVIPSFHPSYLLRNRGNPQMNEQVKHDLKLAASFLVETF